MASDYPFCPVLSCFSPFGTLERRPFGCDLPRGRDFVPASLGAARGTCGDAGFRKPQGGKGLQAGAAVQVPRGARDQSRTKRPGGGSGNHRRRRDLRLARAGRECLRVVLEIVASAAPDGEASAPAGSILMFLWCTLAHFRSQFNSRNVQSARNSSGFGVAGSWWGIPRACSSPWPVQPGISSICSQGNPAGRGEADLSANRHWLEGRFGHASVLERPLHSCRS